MKPALIAPRLKPGALVGVVSPASPAHDDALIMRGLSALIGQGHYPRLGMSVAARDGYLAGPDTIRARDVQSMFEDDRIGAIFCTRGGYGSARLLELLDFEIIRTHPKILVGFSDITALALAFHATTGLISFAGPMVAAEFASGMRATTSAALWDMLYHRRKTRRLPHVETTQTLREGLVEGTLLGGNLTVLCSLIGTPWMPDMRGAVLFIEDVGEAVYRIDRMLLQLKHAGILGMIAGAMLGSFTAIPADRQHRELDEVFREYFLPLSIPVLTHVPFGHIPDKIVLPIGSHIRLDATRRQATILEYVVS